MDWFVIAAGVLLLLSPLNMRWQFGKARRRVIETGGDLERFDRFLASGLVRGCYVLLPVAGIAAMVLGASGS